MVSNKNIKSFIRDLPKVELHLHLEGAIPLKALLFLIEKYNGKDFISLEDLQKRFKYTNFSHFLNIWAWKNRFIKEYEDFELISKYVALDLATQNIRYAEIYFSPTDFRRSKLEPQKIAIAIRKGLNKHSDKITINLIADLVRDEEDKLLQFKQILEVRNEGIIGVGLGGKEKEFPPNLFINVYKEAKKNDMKTTCHAGEAAGSDYIWQAVHNLQVDRIGHGTTAKDDPKLIQYLIDNKIPIEMCPISNVRTNVVGDLSEHPIIDFHRKGMIVSVNTDDPKMFHTDLANEYQSLINTFNLELSDIYHLAQNSIISAWCSNSLKNILSKELSFYFNNHNIDINN